MDIHGTKLDVCVTGKLYNYLKKLHNSHIFRFIPGGVNSKNGPLEPGSSSTLVS
jgi:hypothetical protein